MSVEKTVEDIVFHGPCSHCGRDLWLVLEDCFPLDNLEKLHGHELPDGLGWFALKDGSGWSVCPICGWAIAADPVSLN